MFEIVFYSMLLIMLAVTVAVFILRSDNSIGTFLGLRHPQDAEIDAVLERMEEQLEEEEEES